MIRGILADNVVKFPGTKIAVRMLENYLTSRWHEVDDGQRGVGVAHVDKADVSRLNLLQFLPFLICVEQRSRRDVTYNLQWLDAGNSRCIDIRAPFVNRQIIWH